VDLNFLKLKKNQNTWETTELDEQLYKLENLLRHMLDAPGENLMGE